MTDSGPLIIPLLVLCLCCLIPRKLLSYPFIVLGVPSERRPTFQNSATCCLWSLGRPLPCFSVSAPSIFCMSPVGVHLELLPEVLVSWSSDHNWRMDALPFATKEFSCNINFLVNRFCHVHAGAVSFQLELNKSHGFKLAPGVLLSTS